MSSEKEAIRPLNQSLDLTEVQEAFDDLLAIELLEERLELGCWVKCDLCFDLAVP
jgi:hypothetical protein